MESKVDCDVLVVGGGIAGLMAAVRASHEYPDSTVIVLDKEEASRSGSSVQAKGLAAVGSWSFPGDSTDVHMEDTIKSGCSLNNQEVARNVIDGIESVLAYLEDRGISFDDKDSSLYAAPSEDFAGHSFYRHVHLRDSTGKALLDVLRRQAYRQGIVFKNEFFVTDLLVENNVCYGAAGLDIKKGTFTTFRSASTVIATGGAGYLFTRTSNPPQVKGDGIWLAYEAGAALMDLEMVQFYPLNYVYPRSLEGKNVGSYSKAKLYNTEQERFMNCYDPEHLENTTRDKLSQAIYLEIKRGKATGHGGVYIDRTGLDDEYYKQYPVEVQTCLEAGLDIKKERAEVAPAAHYLMGGVKINKRCESTVEGLYVAGEAAAGAHGANRLANNSLSDTLVLGYIAGGEAGTFADKKNSCGPSIPTNLFFNQWVEKIDKGGSKADQAPIGYQEDIRREMWENVGVVRNQEGLKTAIEFFDQQKSALPEKLTLEKEPKGDSFQIVEGLEAFYMAGLASLIATSALYREESRGAHYREDFPERDDDNWMNNIIVRKDNGEPQIELKRPVQE